MRGRETGGRKRAAGLAGALLALLVLDAPAVELGGLYPTSQVARPVDVTNAVAAEAQARAAGDLVAMTNWQAVVYSTTNGAALGATALQPSWAATGTVAHAVDTTRLSVQGDGDYWVSLCNGTTTTWRVSDDTTRVYIVSASQDFSGPPVGTVFDWEINQYVYDGGLAYIVPGEVWQLETLEGGWSSMISSPFFLSAAQGDALGTCVIDWGKTTNSYPLATHADISTHDDDEAAHPHIRAAIDAIPLPPTNAIAGWLVWDSGSNVYWRVSATNLRFYVWGVSE